MDAYGAASAVGVRLDARSGLLSALLRRGAPERVAPVSVGLSVVTGGVEAVGPIGGLRYSETERTPLDGLVASRVKRDPAGDRCHVVARAGTWDVELEYGFAARSPRVAFGFALGPAPGAPTQLVRDVELTFAFALDDPGDWLLNAPGNQFRADLPVDELDGPLPIFTPGDSLGSPGVIALSRRSAPESRVLWPVCETEIGRIDLDLDGRRLRVTVTTGLAGRASPDAPRLSWRGARLDALAAPWAGVRAALGDWHRELGLAAPADTPRWIRRAHIYEAHAGFSVFAGGHRHERYPAIADLRADLPRIQDLGFDVIQLMPRHPTPATTCTTTRTSPPRTATRPICERWWPTAIAAASACCST